MAERHTACRTATTITTSRRSNISIASSCQYLCIYETLVSVTPSLAHSCFGTLGCTCTYVADYKDTSRRSREVTMSKRWRLARRKPPCFAGMLSFLCLTPERNHAVQRPLTRVSPVLLHKPQIGEFMRGYRTMCRFQCPLACNRTCMAKEISRRSGVERSVRMIRDGVRFVNHDIRTS